MKPLTVSRLGHRRASSAPDSWNLNNRHHVQQKQIGPSHLLYDNSHQRSAPHTTHGWMRNDLSNAQYDQSVMPQAPDFQTYQAAPEAHLSYPSWSSNDTHHFSDSGIQSNGSYSSTHSDLSHSGITPSMSVSDLTQYMNVPVHLVPPVHGTHNPLTTRQHPHQSLFIDSPSTSSSVPSMSSPNTPAYYSSGGEQYSGPSADLSCSIASGSIGIDNHSSISPTLAPNYKHPKFWSVLEYCNSQTKWLLPSKTHYNLQS